MRYFGAVLLSFALMAPALAQTPKPGPAPKPPAAPKPAAAKPAAAAAPNPIAESYAAIPEAERIAIQSDLIWTGDYNGTLSADFGDRAVAAVKAFQKKRGGKETGVLNPQERAALSAAAKPKQEAVGWRMLNDGVNGIRLGLPAKLVPQATGIAGGSRWASARGEVQIETFRIAAPGTTLQASFEAQQKVAERKVSYRLLRPDFFIVSGLQGLKKVYVRGAFKDGEVRGFTVLYDQALEGTVDPVVIAMSSAFTAFPTGFAAAPPPRRKVEYGTGIVIGAGGHIVTTREVTDACQVITLAGLGPAELVAEDKTASGAAARVRQPRTHSAGGWRCRRRCRGHARRHRGPAVAERRHRGINRSRAPDLARRRASGGAGAGPGIRRRGRARARRAARRPGRPAAAGHRRPPIRRGAIRAHSGRDAHGFSARASARRIGSERHGKGQGRSGARDLRAEVTLAWWI
jgi:peptidoglycan hydrolase-like protein with peptidoglycan-binding domain